MDILTARTLDEALAVKAARPEARPIAGGTDLMVAINHGRERPEAVLDLSRTAELDRWERNGDLVLGAGLTYARILRDLREERALMQAARSVGSPQIRNAGTVGGNVGTASPAGDLLPVIAAHDGVVQLVSTERGSREESWQAFFTGPKQTSLRPDELIASVRWRRADGPSVFAKVGKRNAMVIAVCSVCLVLDETARRVRLALGSVAPTVVRATDAEDLAADALEHEGIWADVDAPVSDELLGRFAAAAATAASPIDDVRGTAAYRRHAASILAGRALRWALDDRRSNGAIR